MLDIKFIEDLEVRFNLDLSFLKKKNQGGNGGQVHLYASEEIRFEAGSISVKGGDGEIAGKGGIVNIQAPKIIGNPNINADGGNT